MAKQRDRIQMTPHEARDFIEGRKSMIVASVGPGGAPHLTVLWFAQDDGTYLFETYGKSQKIVNLRRDARVSVLWEDGTAYDELRGVSVVGRAEIVDAEPRLSELMTKVARRNGGHATEAELQARVAQMTQKRVVVVVHPEKTMSWDHRKIRA
jgi:PPOX class probable F420-dependent enzyme